MPSITTPITGTEIFYEEAGDRANETILLVMGLGMQLIHWPDEFVEALVARGYHVVRFDNRDVGLSQKWGDVRPPKIVWQVLRARLGWPMKVPYMLAEMAADAAGLLDALEIDRAHAVGASMGGMIGQLLAINHSEKLHSLTSVMSTTGDPKLPQADKKAVAALTARPTSTDTEALVEMGLRIRHALAGPGYPVDVESAEARTRLAIERSVDPLGLPRQLAAIIDDGDRTGRLAKVTTPTLVIHGEGDPLVKLAGGKATANAIPGARIVTIPGWGHDLPFELIETLADEIAGHAASASPKVREAAE